MIFLIKVWLEMVFSEILVFCLHQFLPWILWLCFLDQWLHNLQSFLEEKKISHFVTYKNNLFKILFGTCTLIFLIGAFIAIPALDIVYGTNLKQYQTSFIVFVAWRICKYFFQLYVIIFWQYLGSNIFWLFPLLWVILCQS